MKKTIVIKIDPRDPDLARIREVARGSREGKIVAFPTETVYGIGAPMSIPGIAEKIAAVKGRDKDKPFAFHIGEFEMVDYLKVRRSAPFRFLTRLFWPGPLTLIVGDEAGQSLGVRFPKNMLVAALINAVGEPFIATSANLSGGPSPKTAQEVLTQLENKIDYLIDGGVCEYREDSTVVDLVRENDPKIVRRGALADKIQEAVERIASGRYPRKRILIVCTGNSCRSPMAEAWLREELSRHGLGGQIEVQSCGVGTRPGASATAEAIYVMKNREIDITGHRTRICTRDDIVNSDVIIAMGEQHYLFITGMLPSAKSKTLVFNVLDPIGMSIPVYEDVMSLIERKIREHWKQIIA